MRSVLIGLVRVPGTRQLPFVTTPLQLLLSACRLARILCPFLHQSASLGHATQLGGSMKTLLKLGPVIAFLFVAAHAGAGCLLLTTKWTAQNPPWTSTVDTHVDVNSEVLTAWRSISGNNGAMCQAIWNNLGPGISGAGNCIRNLYNTGNTCNFDQNPGISVDSRNNTATITLRTSNQLRFTTSVQGVCNVINTGDPNFTANVDVDAKAVLSYNGSELHVNSAEADITHISLSGNNTQAQAIIGMGNVLGS